MLQEKMIDFCAPVLAGLKTANLFNYKFENIDILWKEVEEVNSIINKKDIYLSILKCKEDFIQVYVYRKKQLLKDWKTSGVAELLAFYGYNGIKETNIEENIEHLRERLETTADFPHEIGLFLGYPIEDVKGFIENHGLNYKCVGCWKVYGDECRAKKIFAQYKACRQTYKMLFEKGTTLMQLTVAA